MERTDLGLIPLIYEAGAMPERWPALLTALAARFDAKGAILMRQRGRDRHWILSPSIEPLMQRFVEEGWMSRNPRIDQYNAAAPYAGFQIDDDFMPRTTFETWPIYREFFIPNGLSTGAGTVVQGVKEDGLLLTLEGLGDPADARRVLPMLDMLRPHIARAAILSAQLELRAVEAAVAALASIGTAAALLDSAGRVQRANALFEARFGHALFDRRARLRLRDPAADGLLGEAIERVKRGVGQSIPMRRTEGCPATLNLVPMHGAARDIFTATACIAMVIDPGHRAAPNVDLLQLLFDLTPREASVARLLTQNATLADAALTLGVSPATARSHLKAVFAKTGTNRQAELIGLLTGYGDCPAGAVERP